MADKFIGLNTEQPDRDESITASADVVVVPAERDPDWGAFCGGEFVDGAGVTHLIEGRFNVRNNNVTELLHVWAGQRETIAMQGAKLDDFVLDPFTGRMRLRGHEFGAGATFRAMGSMRSPITLTGWTPQGGGGGGSLTLPTYDPNKATFSDVPAHSDFHEPVEQLAALRIISGYSDGTFRGHLNVTRFQVAKIGWGILRAVARLLRG